MSTSSNAESGKETDNCNSVRFARYIRRKSHRMGSTPPINDGFKDFCALYAEEVFQYSSTTRSRPVINARECMIFWTPTLWGSPNERRPDGVQYTDSLVQSTVPWRSRLQKNSMNMVQSRSSCHYLPSIVQPDLTYSRPS